MSHFSNRAYNKAHIYVREYYRKTNNLNEYLKHSYLTSGKEFQEWIWKEYHRILGK